MKLLILVTLVSLGFAARVPDRDLDSIWELYKTQHSKSYQGSEEFRRRSAFEENVKRITHHNLRHSMGQSTYTLGLNQFADMTNEEFRAMYLSHNFTAATGGPVHKMSGVKAPTSWDWRQKGAVTPVKNQGQCGSCWSFSTTGALECANFRKSQKLVSFSEMQLVDCSTQNYGCNGGWPYVAMGYVKQAGGIMTEAEYPYQPRQGTCEFDQEKTQGVCTGYTQIPRGDENSMMDALAAQCTISICVDASHYSFQLYSSGVYDEPACSSTALDHAIMAVGYGSTAGGQDYWIVKNSWGTGWGKQGYIWMSRNKNNQCGVATAAVYASA